MKNKIKIIIIASNKRWSYNCETIRVEVTEFNEID